MNKTLIIGLVAAGAVALYLIFKPTATTTYVAGRPGVAIGSPGTVSPATGIAQIAASLGSLFGKGLSPATPAAPTSVLPGSTGAFIGPPASDITDLSNGAFIGPPLLGSATLMYGPPSPFDVNPSPIGNANLSSPTPSPSLVNGADLSTIDDPYGIDQGSLVYADNTLNDPSVLA